GPGYGRAEGNARAIGPIRAAVRPGVRAHVGAACWWIAGVGGAEPEESGAGAAGARAAGAGQEGTGRAGERKRQRAARQSWPADGRAALALPEPLIHG